jgi:hypothetical protein
VEADRNESNFQVVIRWTHISITREELDRATLCFNFFDDSYNINDSYLWRIVIGEENIKLEIKFYGFDYIKQPL